MVLSGEAQTLMKGSLYTDELLAQVVKKSVGCAPSGASVIAFCYRCQIFHVRSSSPTPPSISRQPWKTSTTSSRTPSIWPAIGIAEPKVAILSAVETVTNKIP